jgi:hypothetical protein
LEGKVIEDNLLKDPGKDSNEFDITINELRETLQAALFAAFDTLLSPQDEGVFQAQCHNEKTPTP